MHHILPVTQGGGRRWQLWGGAIDPVGSRRLETWAPSCEVDPGAAGRSMESITTFVRRCGWVIAVSWPFSAGACLWQCVLADPQLCLFSALLYPLEPPSLLSFSRELVGTVSPTSY